MKILFTYMGAESLGIEYLGAAARLAGHEVSLAFDPALFSGQLMWDSKALARLFDLRPAILKKVLSEKPDIVAFSCFTGNFLWALSIAEEIKKAAPSIKTVFGGVHVTAVPERVIRCGAVDAAVTGEADETFTALLDYMRGGAAGAPPPGVFIKTGGAAGEIVRGPATSPPADLDTLPFPAKDLFYEKAPALERHYMIMTARGCPYNCTYCYKGLSSGLPAGGNPVRRRSVPNVIAELEETVRRGRAKMIVFRDDVFTLKKNWLREFTEEYTKKIGLPYFCYTHPAALDAETADLIKEGGCIFVSMGIQSTDEKQRREVLNRKYKNEQAVGACRLLKERGITLSLDHIIGIPGDTEDILERAVEFYNGVRPDRLLAFWLECHPGTKIVEIGLEKGFLSVQDKERIEGGDAGRRYAGGGGAGAKSPVMRSFSVFFSLIPLIPAGFVSMILKKKLYRRIPGFYWLNNLLLSANAVRIRDPFFFNNLRFFISRKRVP